MNPTGSIKSKKDIIIDPGLGERLLDGYYFQKFNCSNCNDPTGLGISMSVDVMILQGEVRPLVLKCPNCKTRNLS